MQSNSKSATILLSILVLAVALIVLLPLGLILSLNTLFGLGIALNGWTWLSAAFLLQISGSFVNFKKAN